MPFNNYFNLNRFARLLKQDLLINKTKYFLGILGLGLITYLLCYLFLGGCKESMIRYENSIYNYYMTCFVFYMMAVGVVVGTAFPDLTNKIKTANYLLSPGSTLEKFLVQFLLRMGLFIPITLGIFWIAIRLAKASLIPEALSKTVFFDPSVVPYFEFRLLITRSTDEMWSIPEILIMVFGFFSCGAYLFAGATYFKRYALVKTVIVSVVVWLISFLFMVLLSHIFYPQNLGHFKIQLYPFRITEHLDSISLFFLSLSLLSWIFFLSIAYFKLKEKEA